MFKNEQVTGQSYIISLVTREYIARKRSFRIGRLWCPVRVHNTDMRSICPKARAEEAEKNPNSMLNRSLEAALQGDYVSGYSGRDVTNVSGLA